jgi:hypothetical protein
MQTEEESLNQVGKLDEEATHKKQWKKPRIICINESATEGKSFMVTMESGADYGAS